MESGGRLRGARIRPAGDEHVVVVVVVVVVVAVAL